MPRIKREKQKTKKKSSYSAKDITVLRGLEPVRKRPAMYIGSTGIEGVHHLIKEIIGNSIDEAIMGYCDQIKVSLLPDKRVEVRDNGRGMPVDKHPETKKSGVETIMTYLHSGAKFGGKAYATTGGLHGVGLAAVSALSKYLKVTICQKGALYSQEYSRGKTKTKLERIGKCKESGTTILFEPDPEIFSEIEWSWKKILSYLRQQAYLTKGVKIILCDKRKEKKKSYTFYFEGGLISYVKYLTRGQSLSHPNVFYVKETKEGIVTEAAFRYTKEFESFEESFANNVFTPEGGTHLTAFRASLTRCLNEYAQKENLIKNKNDYLSGRDTRQGITAIISVKVKDPQFEGQTKKRLGNTEIRSVVSSVISEGFSDFLERNSRDARAIVESCILSQKARKAASKARETIFKTGISRFLALPGKLADCSSRNPEERELYILEGQSAGGSAKQGRDRRFQAILPLRGKVLNVEKARLNRVLGSQEIKTLIITLGTSVGDEFDIEKLRYHRIIIMADADVDGMHIRTLLLTLFFRYFKPLIKKGYLYIAQPPLYRIKSGKTIEYVFTEEEMIEVLKKMDKTQTEIQRYKGLGEMNPEQLWKTTMDPENRVLLRVTIEDAEETDRVFDNLMGSRVEPRKKFIQIHAKRARNLDV